MAHSILIIEDDDSQRVMLEAFLRSKMKLKCYSAVNGQKALEILKKKNAHISLVISDINMPIMNGIETLRIIRDIYPSLPVIMLTSTQDVSEVVECMKLGATDFLTKPYEKDRMIVTVQNALKIQTMTSEITRLKQNQKNRYQFNNMIGHDSGLKDVIRLARKAAMIDLPTLIYGETGTGKELLVKAIHGEGTRSGKPFIAVNCGAIPAELVESTLFGNEKGAYTGATEASIGKFREADGGTIFLDEIGELPLSAQVKMLRVIQESEVEPVGASRPVKVNVRIISATHRDLKSDVKQGLFREDLYYRLNVLKLNLPSLRERQQDIQELIDYFMNKIAIEANRPNKHIHDKTLETLQNYDWPGNVRELENMINQAFILSDHTQLTESDFNLREAKVSPAKADNNDQNNYTLQTLATVEADMIREALKYHDGNVTHAAKALGLAKSTLYRKMKDLNTTIHTFI